MATVLEETVEFNGANSDGIWNVAPVGAAGACAAGDRRDIGEVGAAVPRIRDPFRCAVEPVVERELSQESEVADAASPVETARVLHSARFASSAGIAGRRCRDRH